MSASPDRPPSRPAAAGPGGDRRCGLCPCGAERVSPCGAACPWLRVAGVCARLAMGSAFGPAAGLTWGHGAAAAPSPSPCRVWQLCAAGST